MILKTVRELNRSALEKARKLQSLSKQPTPLAADQCFCHVIRNGAAYSRAVEFYTINPARSR
jgi:hypothetical protein